MKVTVISGSPNMDKGNTALILGPFIDGMRGAGGDVSVHYTRRLKINPCVGDYACWFKTPGRCFQKDDMEGLLPGIAGADILVLATPVYVDGITAPLKNLLDRCIPICSPLIELRDDHCRHPGRAGLENGRLVLVANCGFWELDNFDPMLVHMKAIGRNLDRDFAGALLRPHGTVLREMMQGGAPIDDILEAAKEAGRQMIVDGRISGETAKIVSRELIPRDTYIEIANKRMKTVLSRRSKE